MKEMYCYHLKEKKLDEKRYLTICQINGLIGQLLFGEGHPIRFIGYGFCY